MDKEKQKALKDRNKLFFAKNGNKYIEYYHINDRIINDIYPIDVGHEKHVSSDEDLENKFPYFLLHFVIKGKGSITVNGRTTEYSRNSLFVLRPNETIIYHTDKKNPWEYYWINFNGLYADTILDTLDYSEHSTVLKIKESEVKHYFVKALAAKSNKKLHCFVVSECLFGIFAKIAEITSVKKTEEKNHLKLIERISDYIQKHLFDSDLSAKQVAATFFINESYFSILFKKHNNATFKQYVNYERIKKATTLIEDTDMLIKEIAGLVCFTDSLYFSKLFKKYRLVSPENYRLSLKKRSIMQNESR